MPTEEKYSYNEIYVILMARPPLTGKVKSRIALEVGVEKAYEVYSALLQRSLNLFRSLPAHIRCVVSWSEPSDLVAEYKIWENWIQPEGDLGFKMRQTLNEAFGQGASKAILFGTDCPDIIAVDILKALEQLDAAPVVLGPARDGGYYLGGSRRWITELFPPLQWGSGNVFEETVKSLERAGIQYTTIDQKMDIDNWSDWLKWKGSAIV